MDAVRVDFPAPTVLDKNSYNPQKTHYHE
jgi:hypothetical protein